MKTYENFLIKNLVYEEISSKLEFFLKKNFQT